MPQRHEYIKILSLVELHLQAHVIAKFACHFGSVKCSLGLWNKFGLTPSMGFQQSEANEMSDDAMQAEN